MLKYFVGFLKILISILGLIVASGTTLLILDAASVRTSEPVWGQAQTSEGILLDINITITSQAYIFQITDGNLTLIIKTGDGILVDRDSQPFTLNPRESKELSFSLLIPNDTFQSFLNGDIQLFLNVRLIIWMGYQNFNMIGITLVTSTALETGGA